MNIYSFVVVLLGFIFPVVSWGEPIEWGSFTEITIPIDSEQTILIDPPANIEVGVAQELNDKLEVLNTAGRLFITAKEPFSTQKLAIRHSEFGTTLFNLSASEGASSALYTLRLPAKTAYHQDRASENDCKYNYVEIARWVMQHLYAPRRVLKHDNCFTRAQVVDANINLFDCKHSLLCGSATGIRAMASWQLSNGVWVHALSIKNHTSQEVVFDPRDISYNPKLLACVFAHHFIGSAGSIQDNTVAILITTDELVSSVSIWGESG